MIHLYAMTRAPWPVPLTGIDGVAVDALPVGSRYAVVSAHERAVTADVAATVAHAEVVAAVARHVPTLPVRFGRGHRDAETLREQLTHDASLADLLDRVGDHVEFMVRTAVDVPALAPPAGEPSRDGAGRAYLEQRRDEAQRAEEGVAQQRLRLGELTRPLARMAAEMLDLHGPRGPERCFLVPRSDACRFEERARSLLAKDSRLVVGGPWPPFTFAAVAEATP